MKDPDFAPVVIGKLLSLGGMLERKANQLLGPFGLNQQQFSLLFEIAKAGKVNQKAMVNRLLLEKAHVSKIIKKLAVRGLVRVETLPEDRRVTWVSISPEGKALVGRCREAIGAFNRRWLAAADRSRLDGILEGLAELQRVFREI